MDLNRYQLQAEHLLMLLEMATLHPTLIHMHMMERPQQLPVPQVLITRKTEQAQ